MQFIRQFRSAGSTGHVFFVKNGEHKNMGIAYSAFILPSTSVAVVPTTEQIIDFAVSAFTNDKQTVTVAGSVTAFFLPETAVRRFDFTVDSRTGVPSGDWQKALKANIIPGVVRAVQKKMRNYGVEQATLVQAEIEDAVMAELSAEKTTSDGLSVTACSIPKISPEKDVADAIGAPERQAMLSKADLALHTRRIAASENERVVRQFEAQTNLKLEEDRAALIEEIGQNNKKAAELEAEATKARLVPYKDMKSGELLGVALMRMAEQGVESVTIGPELLGALKQR